MYVLACMNVHACFHACVCVCVYCACVCVCVCMRACVCMTMYVLLCVCMCMFMRVYLHEYVSVSVCFYVCVATLILLVFPLSKKLYSHCSSPPSCNINGYLVITGEAHVKLLSMSANGCMWSRWDLGCPHHHPKHGKAPPVGYWPSPRWICQHWLIAPDSCPGTPMLHWVSVTTKQQLETLLCFLLLCCIRVCLSVCTCVFVCVSTCTLCTYLCVHLCMYVLMCAYICD